MITFSVAEECFVNLLLALRKQIRKKGFLCVHLSGVENLI